MKLTTVGASCAIIFLSGCAFQEYQPTAHRAAIANLCAQKRLISTAEFSSYTAFQLNEYPHQNGQSVDDNKLQAMYLDDSAQLISAWANPTDRDIEQLKVACANISVVAQRVAPSSAYQAPPTYQFTAPSTTNCLTTYSFTHCTTN